MRLGKTKWGTRLIRLSTFCVFPLGCVLLLATDHKQGFSSRTSQIAPSIDYSWVHDYCQRHEELRWLLEGKVHLSSGSSPSKEINGTAVLEFDRAIKAIETMNCFIDGRYEDYLVFVSSQPSEKRLEWKSFLEVQREIRSVLSTYTELTEKELRGVFESLLICSVAFKSPKYQQRLEANTSKLFALGQEKDFQWFPSYGKSSDKQKKVFSSLSFFDLLASMHRLEGGGELFKLFKEKGAFTEDIDALTVSFFLHRCMLASEGDATSDWSFSAYDESIHRSLSALRDSCELLKEKDEFVAFSDYFVKRAEWLGFDVGSPLNRVLTRIGATVGLFTSQDGKILKEAILKFSPDELSMIVEEFGLSKKWEEYPAIKLSHVLTNMLGNTALGSSYKERLIQSLHIGLPFIAKVLRSHREDEKRAIGSCILNFGAIAELVTEDPEILVANAFAIEEAGLVKIVK